MAGKKAIDFRLPKLHLFKGTEDELPRRLQAHQKRARESDEDSHHASRYAITFGEVALLHVGHLQQMCIALLFLCFFCLFQLPFYIFSVFSGGTEIGRQRERGFSVSELRTLAASFGAQADPWQR